ncbi:MAG: sulfatase-like hydrolase/transferase [Anaerolineales bacterium]|jgi:arylsulfatase A-like enzyme
MPAKFSRRDFLKLASLLPMVRIAPALSPVLQTSPQKKNILMVLFDAWSAHHLPFQGYPRTTTPFLNGLLDDAIIYHNHISAANFTTPGTASLLTGTYSWTHRAFNHDVPASQVARKNLFNAFGSQYHRIGYSHNPLAAHIVHRFMDDLETYIPTQELYLTQFWIDNLFPNDRDISFLSNFITFEQQSNWNSLFLSEVYKLLISRKREAAAATYADEFPTGLPRITRDNYYILEDGIDWLIQNLEDLPQPFVAYFHFLPPHQPYNTTKKFYGRYKDDGREFPEKPYHILGNQEDREKTVVRRQEYDEYIPYVDEEFHRFYTYFQDSRLAENTRLVLTSDHGEMFERGLIGHTTKLLFEPVVKVPFLLFDSDFPGRQDITTRTSSLDVLPTLLHLNGESVPGWAKGQVLPPFASPPPGDDRQIYSVQAKDTPKYQPIESGSVSIYQGDYKLTRYFGYDELEGEELYELYHLEDDPGELDNLFDTLPEVANPLVQALKAKLEEVNRPYR